MFLHYAATIRSTEVWTPFDLVAVVVTTLIVVWVVRRLRVRRRG